MKNKCKQLDTQQGELSDIERRGIEAIKYLQNLAAIPETDSTALVGWRGMNKHDQDYTLMFYGKMKSEKDIQ